MVELNTTDIHRYALIGLKDKDWYERCTAALIGLFGEDRLGLVSKLLAATSINTSLKGNVTLFRRALYEIEQGLPVGDYVPVMKLQIERIRAGGELSGRKISNFAAAMSGDINAVVVDTWIVRAFKIDRNYFRQQKDAEKGRGLMRSGGVSDNVYTACEAWIKQEAAALRLQPRELCSMIWGGVRIERGNDRQTTYIDFLKRKFINLYNVI